jgi:hypothetical protein
MMLGRRRQIDLATYEPKWLTDYSNKYMLDYEAKVVRELHADHLLAQERTAELAGGRVWFIAPDNQSAGYLLITRLRLLFGLIPLRKPWKHAKVAQVPFASVIGYEVAPDRRWVRVLAQDAGSPRGVSVLIFTGATQPELLDEILTSLTRATDSSS